MSRIFLCFLLLGGIAGDLVGQTNSFVYVSNFADGTVSIIDSSNRTVVGTLSLGAASPRDVLETPNGKSIYVTTLEGNLFQFDAVTHSQVGAALALGSSGFGLAIKPDNSYLIATVPDNDLYQIVNPYRNQKISISPFTAGDEPTHVVAGPDGTFYISNEGDNSVSFASVSLTGGVSLSGSPGSSAVDPAGALLYVALEGTQQVKIVDIASQAVTGTLTLSQIPGEILVSPDGQYLYYTSPGTNTLERLNLGTSAGSSLPIGAVPFGIAFSPEGSELYVSNSASNTLSIVDASTFSVISTVPVGNTPANLSSGPVRIVASGGNFQAGSEADLEAAGIRNFVILDGGTLEATGSFATSRYLSVLSTGGTIDTANYTVSIDGLIEGAGDLLKIGQGTLRLEGNDRLDPLGHSLFQGDLDVQEGTVEFTGDISGFSGNISNSGGIVFNAAPTTINYSGVISGAGEVRVTGGGLVQLFGAHTYTGATEVDSGTLVVEGSLGSTAVAVGSGGTLMGRGSVAGPVSIETGGILEPGYFGAGMLTLGSLNLKSGSTTRLEINGLTPGTDYDQIVVTGSAMLGGRLDLVFGYVPQDGDSFTLLTAGGGVTGAFDQVDDNLGATLQVNLVYLPNSVGMGISPASGSGELPGLTVEQLSFAGFGATPNQMAVGSGLDGLFEDQGTTDLIRYLNTLDEAELQAALEELSPEEFAAIAKFAFAQFQGQFNAFNNRFAELRNGGPAISVAGIRLLDPSGSMQLNPQTLLADTGLENVQGVMMKKLEEPVAAENRWGIYLDGTGTFTDIDGDGNGEGYDFTSGGMTIGVDYRLNENFIAGFQAGYANTDADFDGSGGDMDADSASWGLTLGWMGNQGTYAHGLLGGSYHSFDTERNVLGQKATGETDGLGFNAAAVVGHEVGFGKDKKFKMGPEAALKYSWLNVDEYTEKDALGALTIQEQTPDSLKSRLGWRIGYHGNIGKVKLMPWFFAGWEHEYLDAGQSVAAAFPGSPASGFAVQGVEVARDSAVLGAGVTAGLTETISAKLSYDTEVSPDLLSHSVNGAIRFGF